MKVCLCIYNNATSMYVQATECLLELGADVNVGSDMNTPLFLAVNNRHENIVKLLLRQVHTVRGKRFG